VGVRKPKFTTNRNIGIRTRLILQFRCARFLKPKQCCCFVCFFVCYFACDFVCLLFYVKLFGQINLFDVYIFFRHRGYRESVELYFFHHQYIPKGRQHIPNKTITYTFTKRAQYFPLLILLPSFSKTPVRGEEGRNLICLNLP
jgi:hypothetical protein